MTSTGRILLLDPDVELLDVWRQGLQRADYEVVATSDPTVALEWVRSQPLFDLFVLAATLPGHDGWAVLDSLRQASPSSEVLLCGDVDVDRAVAAMQRGARDYVVRPVDPAALLARVQTILERRHLHRALRDSPTVHLPKQGLGRIRGASPAIQVVRELARRAARVQTSVLICGESGTGKEVVSRVIHEEGDRAHQPFLAVNCGAITPTLAERECFGHEKGAFTGADGRRPGYFEVAQGGTLFLDEIGELSLDLQVKLLRALDHREILPVGATKTLPLDIRFIFATHRDLEAMVRAGTFRTDLYYRINVIRIDIPPLRERPEDIPRLATHFLQRITQEMGLPARAIAEDAMRRLEQHPWPGNARELENVLRRAVALGGKERLELADLPPSLLQGGGVRASVSAGSTGQGNFMECRRIAQEQYDREFLREALRLHAGNISQTAAAIGLARSALQRFLRKYDLTSDTTP